MNRITQIEKYLLNEIKALEFQLLEADKKRKKYLYLDEINKLKHYTDLYNFVINLQI